MADSLNSIGSIAEHLNTIISPMPVGISGQMVVIADLARQHVENYVGKDIGSNSIADRYQPAILDFAKADVVDLVNAQGGGEDIKLEGLSINETGEVMSAEQYRMLGEMKLKALGRGVGFAKSLT